MSTSTPPVIDLQALKDRLDGDRDLFLELTEIFFHDLDGYISAINTALSQGDAKTVCNRAHTIKGALANLSAVRACAAALEIEKLARNEQLSAVPEVFEGLVQQVEAFRERVKEIKDGNAWEDQG